MKKQLLAFAVAALAIVATAGLAYAQGDTPLKANVPFQFIVDNKVVPAGEYRLERVSTGKDLMELENADGRLVKIISTIPAYQPDRRGSARLVFDRYGDQYFLREIWGQGTTWGREIPVTSREKELMSQAAQPETVVIVAALTK